MAAEKFDILRLKNARKTHFYTFSMIWATFCTHQNTAICMYFSVASTKPYAQSTNFAQILTRLLPKWEEHLDRLECEQLQLLTGEKGRKFETSSTYIVQHTWRENWSAFTRLKLIPAG